MDGQNIFDKNTSFSGEWGVDETISGLIAASSFKGAIVVAIDNSTDRMGEYTYNHDYLSGTKHGDVYMKYLVETVKPYVDSHYNTLTTRESTAIGGSSMGGLIAFFGGLAHLETFGQIIALSTSTQQVSNGETNIPLTLAKLNASLLKTTKFFLYVGTSSDGNANWPSQYKGYLTAAGVLEANVKTLIGTGFTHNEYAWQTHFPYAIEWLYSIRSDKTKLNELIVDAKKLNEDDYMLGTWHAFTPKLTAANTLSNKEDASLVEILNAYNALYEAMDQLTGNDDERPAALVDDLLVELPSVADLTDAHYAALDAAIDAYNALTAAQKKLVKFSYVLDLLMDKRGY